MYNTQELKERFTSDLADMKKALSTSGLQRAKERQAHNEALARTLKKYRLNPDAPKQESKPSSRLFVKGLAVLMAVLIFNILQ